MGIFDFFRRERTPVRRPFFRRQQSASRSFLSGAGDNLFVNFMGTTKTADGDIYSSLERMRARSRKLCNDSDYAKKYLSLVKSNVIGHTGIRLCPKTRTPQGELDAEDNALIYAAWERWGRAENCTTSRRLSWIDFQHLFVETVARDGECLVRLVPNFDNEFGFALRILEGDVLDLSLNRELPDGAYISLGVERNKWDEPVAYHLRTKSKTATSYEFQGAVYERVEANEIIHAFRAERPNQSRGVPWLNCSIRALKMLDGWMEAELTGARVAASKMGFYVSSEGDSYVGDDEDSDGALVSNVEPGVFEQLPAGMDIKTFDADYPNTNVRDFVKVTLRSAAAGLGVSYNSLANDLESVNYSSMRSGALEEREHWRLLQSWVSRILCERVYGEWLKQSLLRDSFGKPIPAAKFDKFKEVEWLPRGWTWVDPLKDQQAAALGISLGLTTRQELVSAQGKTLDGIFEQLSQESLLAETLGVNVSTSEPSSMREPDSTQPGM